MDTFNRLPILRSIEIAWDKVKGAKMTFFAVLVFYIVLEVFTQLINKFVLIKEATESTGTDLGTALSELSHIAMSVQIAAVIILISLGVVQAIIKFGLLYLGIRRAADLPIEFKSIGYVFSWSLIGRILGLYLCIGILMLFAAIPLFLPVIGQYFLGGMVLSTFSIICYIATIFLVIFFTMRLFLAQSICIAEQAGPIKSIRMSFKATKDNVFRLIGLSLINLLIVFVSILPLGIGLIWSIPYLFINLGVIYKILVTDKMSLKIV
jgi:hypothetical protein